MYTYRSHQRNAIVIVLLIALVLPVSLFAVTHRPDFGSTGSAHVNPLGSSPTTAVSAKQWTFLVFMAADNNLETGVEGDINEMETVGSTDKVNIVVQLDRSGNYSNETEMKWKGAKRFFINKDDQPRHVTSPSLQDLGEIDSSAPEVLIDFVSWAKKNYPARHYALILWNHGSGWKEMAADGPAVSIRTGITAAINPYSNIRRTTQVRSAALSPALQQAIDSISYNISLDESSGNSMDIPTLGNTLSKIKTILGQSLDIIGFDACLMQMLEIACETAPYAKFQVAATDLEPERGWPYDKILESLVAQPEMDGRKLGQNIVSYYNQSYENGDQGNTAVVLSLIDLGKIPAFVSLINEFCNQAKIDVVEIDAVGLARDDALKYDYPDYRDLGHFLELIKTRVISTQLKTAADAILGALKENPATGFICANGHNGDKYKDASGLSIYLPSRGGYHTYQKVYGKLLISRQTQWANFLEEYETPSLPYIRIQEVVLEDRNHDGRIAAGEDVTAIFSLKNFGRKNASSIDIALESSSQYIESENKTIRIGNPPKSGQKATIRGFVFRVASDTPENSEITLNFTLTGEGIPPASFHTSFFVKPAFQTTGQMLLAFTDGFSPAPPVLQRSFKSAGIKFDTWDRMLDGDLKFEVLKRYLNGWVYLTVQDSSDQQQLTPGEIEALTGFLKIGGRLVLSGQDMAFSLRETPFLKDLCKVGFVQDDTNIHVVTGVQNYLPGTTFQIAGGDGANNQKWPDEIDALPGAQITMKAVPGARDVADPRGMAGPDIKPFSTARGIKSSGTAGVSVNDGYRLLFFAFGIEAINAISQRVEILKQICAFMSPSLDGQILDFAEASSRRPRSRVASSRRYQDDVDLLSGMRNRIIRSVRENMEINPQSAANVLRKIEDLPSVQREASADLERDVRSLVEFQLQHGGVIPR
ncbi:MAG: clostripain-related cysteine peptidase [Candidatus Ozemobacteraceae bacterium]